MATIYGCNYSSYVRTVRLAFEEKGAPYDLEEVDILTGEHQKPEFLARNPFGPVPAFEHDGLSLYETDAITRYVDAVIPGPSLVPADPKDAARMAQVIGINNSYGYGTILGKLVWQRAIVPMQGGTPDEGAIEGAMPRIKTTLAELERIKRSDPWLAGKTLSLADITIAPVIAYLMMTPEGPALMAPHPGLQDWWARMSARPSMEKTTPKLG